ncbi:hypothetical protein JTB14_023280 [Gonioctena quinquepunctata]|nr:hypothetical protein JTB14_023280 [Gonioctena quinquepunctata]
MEQRERIVDAEIEYRKAKYTEILQTVTISIEKGRYTQRITENIAGYETEFAHAKSLLKRHYPKKWNKFEELQVEFNKKNPQKYEISKQTLIDEFRKLHRDEDNPSTRLEHSSEEGIPEPSLNSNLPEDHFRERTKQMEQEMKNPRKEVNTENYEDEYFSHLSNSESEEEIEQSSEKFRKTEKMLEQIQFSKCQK